MVIAKGLFAVSGTSKRSRNKDAKTLLSSHGIFSVRQRVAKPRGSVQRRDELSDLGKVGLVVSAGAEPSVPDQEMLRGATAEQNDGAPFDRISRE
jgi:hypothetical protein